MRTLAQLLSAGVAVLAVGGARAVPPPPKRAASPSLPAPRALRVPGHGAAVLVPPVASARGKRPVVVALHGNFDRPSWACDAWRQLVAGRAFLVCTRGLPRRDAPGMNRFSYPSSVWARREVRAALGALAKRYPQRADTSRVALIGFSLGATFAAKIARREPRRFSRVMLVEGGHTGWKATARRYFKGGGEALVLGCGGWRCAQRARRACKLVARAARRKKRCVAIYARGVGHSYTEPLPARVKPSFDALLLEPLLRHGAAP